MTLTIWEWLKSCETCGQPHQWRWTCPYPGEHGVRRGHPKDGYCKGGTWAAEDGHFYRPFMNNTKVDELQAKYEREAASEQPTVG